MHTRAVVVLGCQIRVVPRSCSSGSGVELVGAAGRRVQAGAVAARGEADPLVVVSGGRAWHGRIEADALADELARLGVPSSCIVRERSSRNTRENAQRTAELLSREKVRHVVLVTCPWHMPRAAALFRREGLDVEPFSAKADEASLSQRAYRFVRELVATRLDQAALAWERS
jgi:uncharacterized SAM-binding protein YcdF (DUF218 family)